MFFWESGSFALFSMSYIELICNEKLKKLVLLSFWSDEKEIASLKSDLSKNKEKLTRALEYKADREELKDHLRKSKEAIALQREETDQVRKDLDEERQSLKMAQWVAITCVA